MKQDTCISGAYAYGAGDRGNFASREIFVSLSGNIGKNEIFSSSSLPLPPRAQWEKVGQIYSPPPPTPPPPNFILLIRLCSGFHFGS